MDTKKDKKLRILCMHGYNITSEIFRMQLSNFIKTYEHIADFVFLEGNYHSWEKPMKTFVKMGFKDTTRLPEANEFPPKCVEHGVIRDAPFRYNCWFYWSKDLFKPFKDSTGGKELRPGLTKIDETTYGVEQSAKYLLDYLNSQEESFDGFMNFSQATMVVPAMFDMLQFHRHEKLKKGIKLPYFVINCASLHFEQCCYMMNGVLMTPNHYMHEEFLPPNMKLESMHITSLKDPAHILAAEYNSFENP